MSLIDRVFLRSFAIGLGPIPFVMIPEVSPPSVRMSKPRRDQYADYSPRLSLHCLQWRSR